jgi:methyl-accepting chemotaxis protein
MAESNRSASQESSEDSSRLEQLSASLKEMIGHFKV